MKARIAVLADYTNISKEGKLNILGIFNAIQSKTLPVVHHSMQLVMSFEIPRSELNIEKELQIKLQDEDGKQIFEIGGKFTPTDKGKPGMVSCPLLLYHP